MTHSMYLGAFEGEIVDRDSAVENLVLRAAEAVDENLLHDTASRYPLGPILSNTDLGFNALLILANSTAPVGILKRVLFVDTLANYGAKLTSPQRSAIFNVLASTRQHDLFMAIVRRFVPKPHLDTDYNLLRAVMNNDPELVRRLIIGDGLALRSGSVRVVVPQGVDVNAHGGKELCEALVRGYAEIVHVLRSHGAEPNAEAIRFLAKSASEELVRAMIEPRGKFRWIGDVLTIASSIASRQWVVTLVAPFVKDKHRVLNALTQCVIHGERSAISTLAHRARRLGITDIDEILNEHLVSMSCVGNVKGVRALLSLGANPNYDNAHALELAVRFRNAEIIKLLTDAGANVDFLGKFVHHPPNPEGVSECSRYTRPVSTH